MIETNGRKLIADKYPIGGFAPGNYWCKCHYCKERFTGDKRAVACEECMIKEIYGKTAVKVGTITNSSPLVWSFDPELYVERSESGEHYKGYNPDGVNNKWCYTPQKSFLSLLSREGHYSENPMGEKPNIEERRYAMSEGTDGKEYANLTFNHDLKRWQESQSRVFEQIVLIEVK